MLRYITEFRHYFNFSELSFHDRLDQGSTVMSENWVRFLDNFDHLSVDVFVYLWL